MPSDGVGEVDGELEVMITVLRPESQRDRYRCNERHTTDDEDGGDGSALALVAFECGALTTMKRNEEADAGHESKAPEGSGR